MEIDKLYLDDTCPEVRRELVRRWRAMTPAEKGTVVSSASRALHQLHLAGIRLRHPGAGEREITLRSAVARLGRENASKVFARDELQSLHE